MKYIVSRIQVWKISQSKKDSVNVTLYDKKSLLLKEVKAVHEKTIKDMYISTESVQRSGNIWAKPELEMSPMGKF